MSTRRKSIGQRIKTAKSPEAKKATVLEWAQEWKRMHYSQIDAIKRAVRSRDVEDIAFRIGLLLEDSDKRFGALPNLIEHLTTTPGEVSQQEPTNPVIKD